MSRSNSGSLPLPGLRWRGLSLQLFLFIFLPLTVILLLITFGSLSIHQQAMRLLVGDRDARAARTAAAAINEQLHHRGISIRGLAARAFEDDSYQEILQSSAYLAMDFDYGMAFFTPEGYLLAASTDIVFWESSTDLIKNLLDETREGTGSQAIYSPVQPYPTKDDLVTFVAASAEENTPIAVGAFSPIALARRTLAGAFVPGEGSSAFIVAPEKTMIYQVGDFSPSESPRDHPGISEALRGESGTSYLEVNGNEHVVTFSPIPLTGWALVIEEPWDSVASPLLNTTQLAPLVLVPVLLLSLAALWFGARQIIQPLQELEARSADLAWGIYNTIEEPVGGIEEISRLQNTLMYLAGKIQQSQEGLHSYIGAITTGQEEERQRLARELHDDTIQTLIALKQRVHLTQMKLADAPQARAAFEEIQLLIEDSIQDLRRLVRGLRPLYLEDLGLVTALQMLVQEMRSSGEFTIEFCHNGIETRLPSKTELALYRIAQEGLSNILHHAQASEATLTLAYESKEVTMTIEDNGRGFGVPESPAEFTPAGHFGLLGIHERAELIGARLDIQSNPAQGTRLQVTLPVN